jgi:hypothetical protein
MMVVRLRRVCWTLRDSVERVKKLLTAICILAATNSRASEQSSTCSLRSLREG